MSTLKSYFEKVAESFQTEKALIKAASKGLKEVITKRGKKDQGEWTEETIRELFKD